MIYCKVENKVVEVTIPENVEERLKGVITKMAYESNAFADDKGMTFSEETGDYRHIYVQFPIGAKQSAIMDFANRAEKVIEEAAKATS